MFSQKQVLAEKHISGIMCEYPGGRRPLPYNCTIFIFFVNSFSIYFFSLTYKLT